VSFADPRPTATDRVRLRIGEFETLAPVVTADESAIRLELADPAVGGAAEIVFSHPRGVISLTGTIAAGGDGAVFTIADTNRLEQRRGAFRLAVACPVHVVRADGRRLEYRTGDLSLTGVRILDANEVEDDELLGLEIQLEDFGAVEVRGQVVRRDELSVGVEFSEVSSAADALLGSFISEAQRRRLRPAAA
jgi:hypothetical protein